MKKTIIATANAPASPLYSQAVLAGGMVYVSGMIGSDPATGAMAGSTVQEQAAQALANCRAVLSAAGASLEDVVEVQVLLARPEDFAGLNEIFARFFPVDPPARSVAKLGVQVPNVLVSIKMTAAAG